MFSTLFNPFPNKPWFLRVCNTSLLKAFSHSVFSPFIEIVDIFIKFEIVVCKLFQFGSVWNLLFGKGLRKLAWLSRIEIAFD